MRRILIAWPDEDPLPLQYSASAWHTDNSKEKEDHCWIQRGFQGFQKVVKDHSNPDHMYSGAQISYALVIYLECLV